VEIDVEVFRGQVVHLNIAQDGQRYQEPLLLNFEEELAAVE
jgi:hypothetical protein